MDATNLIYTHAMGDLILRVTDAFGLTHQVAATPSSGGFQYDRAVYINIEIATSDDNWFITLRVNGRIFSEYKVTRNNLKIDIKKPVVLGSNLSKTAFSSMDVAEIIMYNRVLKFEERQKLIQNYVHPKYGNYFLDVTQNPALVRFRDHQFLSSNETLSGNK